MSSRRPTRVETPLGDKLLFHSMHTEEALGEPFVFDVELLSDDNQIDFSDLLGEHLTVYVDIGADQERSFNGIITSFRLAGSVGSRVLYRATVRPWIWLLSRSANCRIFQDESIPNIVKQIFRSHGFSDFEGHLTGNYPRRQYVVQYRETDFNFVSRLLEHEGIYYYFKQNGAQHTLVLTDSYSGHSPISDCEELPYHPPSEHHGKDRTESVDRWQLTQQVEPGAYATTDYDFKRPRAMMGAKCKSPNKHAFADFEVFEFPGKHTDANEGDAYARIRLEERHASFEQATGHTNARRMTVGGLFNLTDFPRADQNREYLVLRTTCEVRNTEYESGTSNGDEVFECSFSALDSSRPFRPRRFAQKPVIQGAQTAEVVGKSGEEIWTDSYGCVKVKFHWDRYVPKEQEGASCWIRVSQLWAGANWGAMHIPRIGQEVVVEFIEGDPDRPIITGRVYNNSSMPPYALPTNQSQSGIKSQSTKEGNQSNANEIRFEDKKGEEELFIQAEKNQTTKVKASQNTSVGGSRSISVGGDESTSVTGKRSATITKKETQTFQAGREMTVTGADDVTISGKYTGQYNGERDVTVKTKDKLTVSGHKDDTIHGKYDVTADTHFVITQGSNTLTIEKKIEGVSEGPITLSNTGALISLKDGKVTIDAGKELTLVCGTASITLKKDGSIEIAGSQKVAVSGGKGSLELSNSAATISGPKVNVSGAGTTEITGALVKIN